MASVPRVSFSAENLALSDIAEQHDDVHASLRGYYATASVLSRFVGEPPSRVREELDKRLNEQECAEVLCILACLEAFLRIDYLQRCYKKKKDTLSRAFRRIHAVKGSKASLEKEILPTWKTSSTVSSQLISDLKGAFKYRHWLAHGRYWVPKIAQRYDYESIYSLADSILAGFPLEH